MRVHVCTLEMGKGRRLCEPFCHTDQVFASILDRRSASVGFGGLASRCQDIASEMLPCLPLV